MLKAKLAQWSTKQEPEAPMLPARSWHISARWPRNPVSYTREQDSKTSGGRDEQWSANIAPVTLASRIRRPLLKVDITPRYFCSRTTTCRAMETFCVSIAERFL